MEGCYFQNHRDSIKSLRIINLEILLHLLDKVILMLVKREELILGMEINMILPVM